MPLLYLQLHVPSPPRLGPRPPAGSPLLVHLCPEDEECHWGSMGSAVPYTSGTGPQGEQAAEDAREICCLYTFVF